MLKAQVDAVWQRIQPWLNEPFSVSTILEGKVAHMQVVCDTEQAIASDQHASMTHLEKVQRLTIEFFVEKGDMQKLLTDLRAKIPTPAE